MKGSSRFNNVWTEKLESVVLCQDLLRNFVKASIVEKTLRSSSYKLNGMEVNNASVFITEVGKTKN